MIFVTTLDVLRLKKKEVHRIGLPQKLVGMDDFVADMEREQELSSRFQDSPHFSKCSGQGLSRNAVTEGAFEYVGHSVEGGQDCRSRLNLVAGRLTVPNVESRCNQLKLGHPLLFA